MKMYVPEIGDHVVLTEDWNFILHPESRNQDLGKFFGYSQHWEGWINDEALPPMRDFDYKVNYPNYDDYRNTYRGNDTYNSFQDLTRQAEQNCPEYVKYWADQEEWNTKAEALFIPELKVTLPAGTVLAIDRIYIRKGSSDYSSITFYAKTLGTIIRKDRWSSGKEKKKSALRFWAKLDDCNNIVFEKTDKIK